MYDSMIQELFPDRNSEYFPGSLSSLSDSGNEEFYSRFPEDYGTTVINCLDGEYNLSHVLSHYGEYLFPSSYVRKTFLHLQLLCSATFDSQHYTLRKDLPSYLLSQTFFGEGILRYEGQEYTLEEGDLFLIDCRREHEYFASSENGWGYRFLHFDGCIMPGYYEQIKANGNVIFHFDQDSRFQKAFKELYLSCENKSMNHELIENRILTDMVTEILCCLPQYSPEDFPVTIKKQCSWLKEHCREKLTLEQIAKEFGLSKYYISREFKKYTSSTFFSYIAECRIDIALRMLRYSDVPVCQIAEYVGFSDHNAFYRAFREREGMSPSSYRQRWKGI